MTVTLTQVASALPAHLKSAATQSLVDMVNNVSSDPVIAENIRNNFLSYTNVLREGRFKTDDYLNAVAYCSFKLMGKTNEDAYMLTFPQRYNALIAGGRTRKDISAYVSAYNKGKLVNLIMEQTLVPSWVLNQDLYQKALNVQADLMVSAVSEKVRTDAANSILTHLKKPEAAGATLTLDVKESSGMNELRNAMEKLAETQRDLIRQGVSAKELIHQPIIEGESKVVL